MDHRAFGILLSATFGDLPSVDASGQLDVRDENVGDSPPVPRQCLFAVSHMDDLVLFLSQSVHHELLVILLVLEHSTCSSDTAYQWPRVRFEKVSRKSRHERLCSRRREHNERRADCSQTDAVEQWSGRSPVRRLLVGVAT